MDPNAALANIRALSAAILRVPMPQVFDLANELAEQIQNLDEWLVKGGLFPADWNQTNRTNTDA